MCNRSPKSTKDSGCTNVPNFQIHLLAKFYDFNETKLQKTKSFVFSTSQSLVVSHKTGKIKNKRNKQIKRLHSGIKENENTIVPRYLEK